MEREDIEALIKFHKAGLREHRQFMSISAVYLEEQTIKALEELKDKRYSP
ncbi:unnamed protein product [marine sediment metagenome]|uniref:HEPN domain-containing protein n=1 Tax=marine sediment metagenome TaxID=412755 RepID=X1STJ5_9ZZZZ